jgi:hypothetical protein
MLMESRAAWALACELAISIAVVASVEIRILRVTVLASGCDARQFITGRLRKYFNEK